MPLDRVGGRGRCAGEQLVEGQREGVAQHARQQSLKQLRALLEAGVRVGLDQPRLQLPVHYEVKAEDLKAVLPPVRVQFPSRRHRRNRRVVLHLGEDAEVEGIVVEVGLEGGEGELVAVLEGPVVGAVLLHGVVRQVDVLVRQRSLVRLVLAARRPQIPLPI